MDRNAPGAPAPQPIAALMLTMVLFAIWGFGQRLYDGLLPQFATMFEQKGIAFAAGPAVSTAAYLLGAIPAALAARSFGYKGAILLGMGIFCVGSFLIYPATESRSFQFFLCAVAVMTFGWTTLEMAVNPLVASLGSRETALQRLNIAHAIYVPGALLGMVVTRWILASSSGIATAKLITALMHPYIVFGAALLLVAFLIEGVRFPSVATDRSPSNRDLRAEFGALFTSPLLRFCIAAQAFSMIAQVGVWNQCLKVLGSSLGSATPVKYLDGIILLVAILAAGRLAGTALMCRFRPARLLAAFSCCGVALSVIGQCTHGWVSAAALMAAGFCLAINWPTIIGLGIRDLGPLMKLGVAPICMGGTLGGFGFVMLSQTLLTGLPHVIMAITIVSFGAILWFAIWYERKGQGISIETSLPLSPRQA